MSSTAYTSLQTPYQIGGYIRAQFPNEQSEEWEQGPNPEVDQIESGYLLQVDEETRMPRCLLMRYGRWEILKIPSCNAEAEIEQTKQIFELIKENLGLERITINREDSYDCCSFWAVRKLLEEEIDAPILKRETSGISKDEVQKLFGMFLRWRDLD